MIICFAHTLQFRLEFSSISFKLFGEFLCHCQSFESIIPLSFRPIESFLEMRGIDFLLINEKCKTMSFSLVLLDLGFEFLCLLSKLCSERLEFFKLKVSH